jgi:hypothetical protein
MASSFHPRKKIFAGAQGGGVCCVHSGRTKAIGRSRKKEDRHDKSKPQYRKETIMKTLASTLMIVLAVILAPSPASLSAAVDYGVFNGSSENTYSSSAKYVQWGLINAFDAIGLQRRGYWHCGPADFMEDSLLPGSTRCEAADWSTVTVYNGGTVTLRDCPASEFYLFLGTRNWWNGENWTTSRSMRLGESWGVYPGSCRYFFAVGSDTIARGPAMSDAGWPTFSLPSQCDEYNTMHAYPFRIWKPVMTDGLRMVMGLAGYHYFTDANQEKWQKFGAYWRNGYSIAESFARTALDAHPNHMPIVLAQAASYASCDWMLEREHDFLTERPAGNTHFVCSTWIFDRERTYDGYYVWCRSSVANLLSRSTGAQARQGIPAPKTLHVLGFTEGASVDSLLPEKKPSTMDDKQQLWVDRRTGNRYYRQTPVSEQAQGPCVLTVEESLEKAVAFVEDHGLAPLDELTLDGVVTISRMIASAEEIDTNTYSHKPEISGYIIVLKRNLGDLPILTNDVDTVTVEIRANGEVASAVSNYRSGGTLAERETVTPKFLTAGEAKKGLLKPGTAAEVTAGFLPTQDGSLVPVYEVVTQTRAGESSPQATVKYYRMDTLEPLGSNGRSDAGPEAHGAAPASAQGR